MGGKGRPRRVGDSDGFDPIPDVASVPLPASLSDLRCAGIDAETWRHASDGKPAPDAEDLDPTAFRTLVAMVWHAYDRLSGEEVRHRMSAAVLKAYAVVGSGHASYDGVRQALRILASTQFGEKGKTPERLVDVHLPPGYLLNSGMVEYGFTARGRNLFGLKEAGGLFVRAELAVVRALKSVHAMRLYLLLARYPERREPVLNATPSELCDLLGIPEKSTYRRQYAALKARVLAPCLEVIAARSTMTVTLSEKTAGKGLKVQSLHFSMARREALPEAPSPTSRPKATGLPGVLADVESLVAALPEFLRHREAVVRRHFDEFVKLVGRGEVKVGLDDEPGIFGELNDWLADIESEELRRADAGRANWDDRDASDLSPD